MAPLLAQGSPDSNATASPVDQQQRFEEALRAIWVRDWKDGSMAKDLPRLARRVTVRTRDGVLLAPEEASTAAAGSSAADTFSRITALVMQLTNLLEPTAASRIAAGLAAIGSDVTDQTQLEEVVPAVAELLGPESKTLGLLKLIDQNVS